MSGERLPEARLLLFHKQGTSARTRFVRWPHGMLAFSALPEGARLLPDKPVLLIRPPQSDLARRLGLAQEELRFEPDFVAQIDTPAGRIDVSLVQCTSLDPPFAAIEALGGRFIAITEARDCPPLELQLLRQAYEILIG